MFFWFRVSLLHLLSVISISACGLASVKAPAPVAAYAFNEATGTTVADASGNGNIGTVVHATWTHMGHSGGALSFGGTTAGRVTVPDAASLHLTEGMTLEAWVNPSATVTTTWQAVIYKGLDVYLLGTNSPTGFPVGGGKMGAKEVLTSGVALLPLHSWTHMATTYDGTTLRLYINGAEVSSLPDTGRIRDSTAPLEIGGSLADGGPFSGLIDDVRLYSTALTAAQIQADMNTPVESR